MGNKNKPKPQKKLHLKRMRDRARHMRERKRMSKQYGNGILRNYILRMSTPILKQDLIPSCGTVTDPDIARYLQMSAPILTQEVACNDADSSNKIESPSEQLLLSEFENYYDNKTDVSEQPKKEFSENVSLQADCSLNRQEYSENRSLEILDNEAKCENTDEGLLLNIKEDDKLEHQVKLKTDRQEQYDVLDNDGDTKHSDAPTTPREIEYKLVQKTVNSINLFEHNNEVEIDTLGNNETNDLNECQYCDKRFDNYHSMLVHISDAHKIHKPTCKLCGKQFQTSQSLQQHLQLAHNYENQVFQNSIQCKCCNEYFENKYIFEKHQNLCKSIEKDEKSNTKLYLTTHMKTMHFDDSRSPTHVGVHERCSHRNIENPNNDKFQCDSCKKCFKLYKNLFAHIMRVHYDYGRFFDCDCGKRFRTPIELIAHKKSKNLTKFQCDYCQKIFKGKHDLIRHIKKMHYDYGRTFDCWCGKVFRSPIHLREHKNKAHVSKANEKFQYDSCQMVFNKKQGLAMHMGHHDIGPISECWCGERFSTPILLRKHKKLLHKRKTEGSNNKKFQCDSCQKIFNTRNNLTAHIEWVHNGYGKVFECWCGDQFHSPIRLRQHKRHLHDRVDQAEIRTNMNPKLFNVKPKLDIHTKDSEEDNGKRFKCWCGEQYCSSLQLYEHKNTSHVLEFGGYKFCL